MRMHEVICKAHSGRLSTRVRSTPRAGRRSKVGAKGKAVDELLSFHSAGRARDGLETGNERH